MHVMRDGTIAVEYATNQIQEQFSRNLNRPERQALPLGETCFWKPSVKFDIAKLSSIGVAVFAKI